MPHLLALMPAHLSLHPIAGTMEVQLTPQDIRDEEYCRRCTPFGLSVHLFGDPAFNRIIMVIDFGSADGPTWRVHIDHELWVRGDLERTIQGIEPLFEVHPLGWGSEVHTKMVNKWGNEHGVVLTVEHGRSRHLFVRKRPHD